MLRPALIAVLAAAVACSAAKAEKPELSRAVMLAGLKKAKCDVSPEDGGILESDEIGRGMKLVQVSCWRAAYNFGSILFLVPSKQPSKGRLVQLPDWDIENKRPGRVYSVSSPGFDSSTGTLHSAHKLRGVGDCGIMNEWKWTGSGFQLTGIWLKAECDGEPWVDDPDDKDKFRVYPPKKKN
jgi:hypothetical protein